MIFLSKKSKLCGRDFKKATPLRCNPFIIKAMLFITLSLAMLQPPRLQSISYSVWDVMRSEFKLDHHLNRPEVQRELRWLMAHPGYLTQLNQARPYLYHIVTEIKKRSLPGELALIPMIESSFDPFAYSGAGAAGLWQLMPLTGKDLGLKQDWWSDSRRSIAPSTNAALDYLSYLNQFFKGNWDLAIAAYDAGEGTMARAIKAAREQRKASDFWSLAVPQETQHYLPKLLALAEIITYPNRYHMMLPYIPHTPYFEEVNIKSHIDLNHAAKMAGMSYRELIKLNPGFNRWTTRPYQPFKLLIPTEKVDLFYQNLALDSLQSQTTFSHYYVQHDDTLDDLARRFSTTAHQLKQLNQLDSNDIQAGQQLLVPANTFTYHSPKSKAAAKATVTPSIMKVLHIVQSYETLEQIAKKYHTTVTQIKQWNHLTSSQLRLKQQLMIWKSPPMLSRRTVSAVKIDFTP